MTRKQINDEFNSTCPRTHKYNQELKDGGGDGGG